MTEKIKVSIPSAIRDLLGKDCEDFKIYKSDGSPNINAFINTLLINFYEEFSAAEESLHDEIRAALFPVPDRYKDDAFKNMVKMISKRGISAETKKSTVVFSFKPTKAAESAVTYIERILSRDESISSFYRRLFSAYAGKPKNEREKIIHKDNYSLLQRAIKKEVQACLTLTSGEHIDSASIYAVGSSKDELFNYVLAYTDKGNSTIRLASIKLVNLLPARAEIPTDNRAMFDRQIAAAIQYPIYRSDREQIRVKLTEKGKKLFEKVYLYRPVPTSIDGDVYTFDCSANQILYYFERFGDSALILSPKRIGIFMRNYYYFAYKKYRSIYRAD